MLRMIKVTLGLLVLALILQISILYAIYSGHGFQILMLFYLTYYSRIHKVYVIVKDSSDTGAI